MSQARRITDQLPSRFTSTAMDMSMRLLPWIQVITGDTPGNTKRGMSGPLLRPSAEAMLIPHLLQETEQPTDLQTQ